MKTNRVTNYVIFKLEESGHIVRATYRERYSDWDSEFPNFLTHEDAEKYLNERNEYKDYLILPMSVAIPDWDAEIKQRKGER